MTFKVFLSCFNHLALNTQPPATLTLFLMYAASLTLTGLDKEIIEWLATHDSVQQMLHDISSFLENWIPTFETNQKAYMTISIGCTGGRHRSVYITEHLAKLFETQHKKDVIIHHRELTKR